MFVYTAYMLSGLPKFLNERTPPEPTRQGLVAEIELLAAAQSAMDAYRHRVVVAINSLGDRGIDATEVLRSVARMSSRAAGRVAKSATSMADLPRCTAALAAGQITSEHANVLADAARDVDSALVDDELMRVACAAPADLFARQAREWISVNHNKNDAETTQARRHTRRAVSSWTDDDGMRIWLAKLDPVTAAEVSSSLDAEYDRLWRLDGGRESQHRDTPVRSPQQRMADAFVSLITGSKGGSLSGKSHLRHHMMSIVDLSRMRVDDPRGSATLIDGTSLPQKVLERLACISDITGVIFDGPGQPIWVGRSSRHATPSQWKALIARDRGCVGCGADPNRCEAHHIRPWDRGGATDIVNLVLVCSRCHHNVHDRGMRLTRGPNGWTITSRAGPANRKAAA